MMRTSILVVLLVTALAACQQVNPPAPKPAGNPKTAQDLNAYRELRAKQSWELAASIGEDLVQRAPGTPEAAEVQQTLAEVKVNAEANRERKRLAGLWTYQTGTESGGAQSTASIYSSTPGSEAERVDLILRRHSEWGNNAYLFGHVPGFECGEECLVDVSFDGAEPVKYKAYSPETGEPALMLRDEAAFVEALSKSKTLKLDVKLKDKGAQTLSFETGGFDPNRFAPLPPKG